MGRGKVELKRIENPTNRQVTFSKRKNGILKKAFELSVLCEAEVAVIIFSPSGKAYQFASEQMDKTIARYRSEVGLLNSNRRSKTAEFWKSEIEELERLADAMEARARHLAGEDISTLGLRELKKLERQLKAGVERIRSKKRRILSEHMNLLKRRQRVLQEENAHLQKRVIKLHELHDVHISSNILGIDACAAFQQRFLHDAILR